MEEDENSERTLELALNAAKREIDEAREELSRKEANKFTYEEFINKIDRMMEKQGRTACPTCNRAFEDESEARDLQTDLREMVRKIPDRVKAIKERITGCERRQERFVELYSRAQHFEEMRSQVESMKKTLDKTNQVGLYS